MKKKLAFMTTAILAMVVAFSTVCYAASNDETYFVNIDGETHRAKISEEQTPYGEPAVDSVPHLRGIMPRVAVVTASDVHRYQDLDTAEYFADGYVIMKDGSANAWHYSLAEMWWQGSLDVTGSKNWGYGRVPATSWTTENPGQARIFYGIN